MQHRRSFVPDARLTRTLAAASLALLFAGGGARAQSTTLKQAAANQGKRMGAAIKANLLSGVDPVYVNTLKAHFNQISNSNEMKLGDVHPRNSVSGNTFPLNNDADYNWGPADTIASFGKSNNMRVRGHTLVYTDHAYPDWIDANNDRIVDTTLTSTQLKNILHDHIVDMMTRYKSDGPNPVHEWDVVNEAFYKDGRIKYGVPWFDKPGIGFPKTVDGYYQWIEQCFRWARQADPNAVLYYNDNAWENDDVDTLINDKADRIYDLVQYLRGKREGTRHLIDGVGFQVHVGLNTDLSRFRSNINRFVALGVKVQVTEMDVSLKTDDGVTTAELNAQRDKYREVVDIIDGIPQCPAFQMWGFTDKYSWIPAAFPGQGAALPWDENYNQKPAWYAIRNGFDSVE